MTTKISKVVFATDDGCPCISACDPPDSPWQRAGNAAQDCAAHNETADSQHGWLLPAAPGALRKLQLRTDVGLSGTFLLRLSGETDAFRVWQSEHPATNATPLLVSQQASPQTVTNGVNEISWNTSSTATLYIEALSSGAATLTYTFIGSGSAEGINRRASLNMTAWKIEPDEMNINWKTQNTALNLTPSGGFGSNGVVWAVEPSEGLSVVAANHVSLLFSPSNSVPGEYVVSAMDVAFTNAYDTCVVRVYKTASVEAMFKTIRSEMFEGQQIDFGNCCANESSGKSLDVFYKEVSDGLQTINNFNVYFWPNFIPESMNDINVNGTWNKTSGPESGYLAQNYPANAAVFFNAQKGGVYKFEYCAAPEEPPTGAVVHLPLAGPDVTQWLAGEVVFMRNYGNVVGAAAREDGQSWIPFKTCVFVLDKWIQISGGEFDYEIYPKNPSDTSPCSRYRHGKCWPVTVNGVVVHGSNINNMLWSVFGRSWGWSTLELKAGAHLNQISRGIDESGQFTPDPPGSQHAVKMGGALFDRSDFDFPNSTLTEILKSVLTPVNVKAMQDTNIYGEDSLWPCNEPYDWENSIMTRPAKLIYWR